MQRDQADIEVGRRSPNNAEIRSEPWRFIGYPGFIEFIASDPELLVTRRFDKLHTRALLFLQDQVAELEERIGALNDEYIKKGGVDNGTFRGDESDRRKLDEELVQRLLLFGTIPTYPEADLINATIHAKQREDSLQLKYSKLCSLQRPLKQTPKTVRRWLSNNGCFQQSTSGGGAKAADSTNNIGNSIETTGGAVDDKEAAFVTHVEDLIAIRQAPKVAIRAFFDHLVVKYSDSIFKPFRKTPDHQPSHWKGDKLLVSCEERVNRFMVVAELLAALTLFVAPLWILQAVKSVSGKLVIITVFVLACLLLMSFAMSGSPFQVLAATAGYSAVLVVFVQPVTA